jgi:hypothetical protein
MGDGAARLRAHGLEPLVAHEIEAAGTLQPCACQNSCQCACAGPATAQGPGVAAQRGRVRMVLSRLSHTSGRRLARWGFLRGSLIQFRIALRWYLGCQPEELRELYERLYTDAFR